MELVSVVSRFDLYRRATLLFAFTLATAAYGCGSAQSTGSAAAPSGRKAPAQVLKPDQLWKYEGTGTEKRKVQISRRERVNLLHEAQQKTD